MVLPQKGQGMNIEIIEVTNALINSTGAGFGLPIIKHANAEMNETQKRILTRLYRLNAISFIIRSFDIY